jgi:hypothetical protein
MALPEEPTAETVARADLALPRALVLFWALMVAALLAYLAFGTVRLGAGNWIGRRMPLREVWTRFLEYLTNQGASPGIVLAVTAAAGLSLVGAGCVLWLAFGLRDSPSEQAVDDEG